LAGVELVMEENKTPNPRKIGFFRGVGIIEASDPVANLVEQFGFVHLPHPEQAHEICYTEIVSYDWAGYNT
jgi:hypothetical protein